MTLHEALSASIEIEVTSAEDRAFDALDRMNPEARRQAAVFLHAQAETFRNARDNRLLRRLAGMLERT